MPPRHAALLKLGERRNSEGKAITNKILLSIPVSEYRIVRPALEYLVLTRHERLHEPGEGPQFVYFPNNGLLSLVVVTSDGRSVEAGIAGKEGIVGLADAFGLTCNPIREVVQISGDAFKIEVGTMEALLRSAP